MVEVAGTASAARLPLAAPSTSPLYNLELGSQKDLSIQAEEANILADAIALQHTPLQSLSRYGTTTLHSAASAETFVLTRSA